MFDIAPTELLIVALVALVVIGPKDLPRVMRTVGHWVGRARGMARHFRSGIDTMIRESELEEMEKKWKAENERIMREHPALPPATGDDAPDYDHPAVAPAEPAPLPAPASEPVEPSPAPAPEEKRAP
jgi:sec-independent protein translocase protein TatB